MCAQLILGSGEGDGWVLVPGQDGLCAQKGSESPLQLLASAMALGVLLVHQWPSKMSATLDLVPCGRRPHHCVFQVREHGSRERPNQL